MDPDACAVSGAEEKFGVRSAWLYPFLGHMVSTPKGSGKLIQVFSGRASVLFRGQGKENDRVEMFSPDLIGSKDPTHDE